jgi:hypothetical protein
LNPKNVVSTRIIHNQSAEFPSHAFVRRPFTPDKSRHFGDRDDVATWLPAGQLGGVFSESPHQTGRTIFAWWRDGHVCPHHEEGHRR